MSRNRKKIAEIAGDRHDSGSKRGNGKNGHNVPSGPLSWYFAQPLVKEVRYVLTANGYVILPTGLPRSREGIDREELMM